MIYTCSYKNFKTDLLKGVSISVDRGKGEGWSKDFYSVLAPKLSFWKIWHENIGKISDDDNNKYYIEEYYKQVLAHLDPLKIYRELDYSFLLCYEESEDFCHRHIVAAWFELFLGLDVREVKVTGLSVEEIKKTSYIKDILENVIRDNLNMCGFKSIRAYYLFNKSEELEQRARELEEKYKKPYDNFYQDAAYLRSDADRIEEEYKQNNSNKKILINTDIKK